MIFLLNRGFGLILFGVSSQQFLYDHLVRIKGQPVIGGSEFFYQNIATTSVSS